MITASEFLIELDLSWNEMKPILLLEFTKFLKENRTLRVLNLSWNFMTTHQAGG
jgi:hypothetical protein